MSYSAKQGFGVRSALGVWKFVKTTLVGGLVFLVPLFVLVFVATKVAGLLGRVAQPLAEHLPLDTAWGVLTADAIVILLLVLACFIGGLLARVSFAKRVLSKAESGVLWHIPGYGLIKALTATLDGNAAASALRPVLIHFDDYAQLGFEVEQLTDGRKIVYIPSAPEPRSGSVFVMDADRVEAVPIGFMAAVSTFRALGRGSGACLSPPRSRPRPGMHADA